MTIKKNRPYCCRRYMNVVGYAINSDNKSFVLFECERCKTLREEIAQEVTA